MILHIYDKRSYRFPSLQKSDSFDDLFKGYLLVAAFISRQGQKTVDLVISMMLLEEWVTELDDALTPDHTNVRRE